MKAGRHAGQAEAQSGGKVFDSNMSLWQEDAND